MKQKFRFTRARPYTGLGVIQPAIEDISGLSAVTLPAGGTSGQVIKKSSGSDYDFDWAADSTGGGGGGGSIDDALALEVAL